MRNNQQYVVTLEDTTEVVSTLKEVKALLGDSKITTKGIMSGDYPMVTLTENTANGEDEVATTTEEDTTEQVTLELDEDDILEGTEEVTDTEVLTDTEEVDTGDSQEEDSEDTEEDTDDSQEEDEPQGNVDPENDYPEIGDFKDDKEMKKYIKKLSNKSLEEWCILEGATWKPNDHESINRMRMAMAIKAIHFPDLAPKGGSKKKKSKYADYSTEQLVEMALDNDVAVPDDKGDMRICRMYTIMALRKAGIIE